MTGERFAIALHRPEEGRRRPGDRAKNGRVVDPDRAGLLLALVVSAPELLAPLARAIEANRALADDLLDDLSTTWTTGQVTTLAASLPADALEVVKKLSDALAELSRAGVDPRAQHELFEGARGAVVLAWAEAAAGRRDVVLAPLLSEALRALQPPSRLIRAARARVTHGSLLDGLACLPLAGDPSWLIDPEPEHALALARTELLIIEAAASGLSLPAVGAWLFAAPAVFDRFVAEKSRGVLRERIAAASWLAIAADGFPQVGFTLSATSPRAGAAVRIVRTLASHPEPLVWIPASIALGRLASRSNDARGVLCLWLHGEAIGERRRAITALAAMTDLESWSLDATLAGIISGSSDPWELAAIGPAIPFLSVEHRELYDRFLARLRRDDTTIEASWSAARGLLAIAKRGPIDRASESLLRDLRDRALAARVKGETHAQLWAEIARRTDFLDGIDPDPSDPELLLERAAASAVELGADRLAPRVAAIARGIGPTFDTALARSAATNTDPSARAAALSAIDSSVRAASLANWELILGPGEVSTELERVRARMLDACTETLLDSAGDFPRSRALLRALGLLIDAPSEAPKSVRAGRVLSAIDRFARIQESKTNDAHPRDSTLDAITHVPVRQPSAGARNEPKARAAGARELSRLKKPIADALWRVVDATRPDSIVLPDSVVYSRFAAWCALSAESELLLAALPRTEAAARGPGGATIAEQVAQLRAALDPRAPGALEGKWVDGVVRALDALGFGASALAEGVAALGVAVQTAARARTTRDGSQLALALIALGESASQLSALIADPARALNLSAESHWPTDQYRDLAAETVQAIGLSNTQAAPLAQRWSAGLGPVLGPIVGAAVEAILATRTERSGTFRLPSIVGGYRLLERLGRGAQGEAWLVEHERTTRRFVMKLLPDRTLIARTPEQRAELERAIAREGELLKTIYHPNVANFVDYGVVSDRCYLVLEYLVGCDLGEYSEAKLLTLPELKPIVHDICAGLSAIASFGLIHGDLKPGNIFLRLALPQNDMSFTAARDREQAPLLGAVVIDLGVARTLSGADVVRDVSGTPGYLAPEQAHGKAHPKTDVYSLAATIYKTLAGRAFFSHLEELGARVFAHASRQPFDDPAHLHALPPLSLETIALLKEATAMSCDARPDIATFARRFAAL